MVINLQLFFLIKNYFIQKYSVMNQTFIDNLVNTEEDIADIHELLSGSSSLQRNDTK